MWLHENMFFEDVSNKKHASLYLHLDPCRFKHDQAYLEMRWQCKRCSLYIIWRRCRELDRHCKFCVSKRSLAVEREYAKLDVHEFGWQLLYRVLVWPIYSLALRSYSVDMMHVCAIYLHHFSSQASEISETFFMLLILVQRKTPSRNFFFHKRSAVR